MFSDAYLDKEENEKVLDVLFQWMTGKLQLNAIDAEAPDVSDYHFLPSTAKLSEDLRVCLQDGDEAGLVHCMAIDADRGVQIPRDFTKLIETPLHQLDTRMIPESIRLYDTLGLQHEALSLIPPVFETPLPPLQPAVRPVISYGVSRTDRCRCFRRRSATLRRLGWSCLIWTSRSRRKKCVWHS